MATETAILPKTEWLAEVVRSLERPLVRYAFSLTRDYSRARDAVQETFLELWRRSSTVDRSRPAPWLFAVCRARSVVRGSREPRVGALPTCGPAERASHAAPLDPSVLALEPSADAVRLLGLLPEREREVVRLKFQEGLSYKEIAEVTGHSVGHVGVMIHNAILRVGR